MTQRIIRFRVWNETRKEMVSDLGLHDKELRDGEGVGFPVMQFTGLLDRNGKEIYESDLLEIDGLRVEVEWYGGAWTVQYFTEPKRSQLSLFDELDVEIIGNKYELN